MNNACPSQPLDEVADMLSGGTPRKSHQNYWNGLIPWLTPKDMDQWSGVTEAKVSPEAIGNGTRLAPEKAIFIVVRGMSLHNEIRVLRPAQAMTFNQDIKAIVARENIDPCYLFYVLLSKKPELLDAVEAAGHGTGRLPTDKLKDLSIPRFGSFTETAIAELFAALDRRIELNRRMNEALEAMARAIFKDWFVDFGPTRAKAARRGHPTDPKYDRPPYLAPDLWALFPDALDDDDKPVGWQVGSISDLADTNHQSWTARNHPPFVEYVDLSNAKWGNIDAITTLAWDEAPSRARRIAKSGDTIVGTTRPGNGSFAYISQDGLTVSTGFAVLSPRADIYRDVVYIAATRPDNIKRLANLADGHGGAYPAVRPNEVSETELLLPGGAILTAFSEVVSPFRAKIESAKVESRTLAQTRDLLLPKLMSGEIRLAEAEKAVEAVA